MVIPVFGGEKKRSEKAVSLLSGVGQFALAGIPWNAARAHSRAVVSRAEERETGRNSLRVRAVSSLLSQAVYPPPGPCRVDSMARGFGGLEKKKEKGHGYSACHCRNVPPHLREHACVEIMYCFFKWSREGKRERERERGECTKDRAGTQMRGCVCGCVCVWWYFVHPIRTTSPHTHI